MTELLPGPWVGHEQDFDRIRPQIPEQGDIIEFGVFQGGTTRQLATWGRRVWALDTYGGMPSEDFSAEHGDHDLPGKFNPSEGPWGEMSVWRMFKDFPNICPLKGRFVETLPIIPPSIQIAFAYMDCDLYESYHQAFSWLEKHLMPKAHVLIDDYGACAGCRKAVDEWSADKPIEWIIACKHFIWKQ